MVFAIDVSWSRRLGVVCAATAVLVCTAAPPARAAATAARSASAPPAVRASGSDQASIALDRARSAGVAVEIPDLGSENSRVMARPDGTFELDETAVPTRVRRSGGWVPVDTTLRTGVTGVTTAATTVGITFSAGGRQPLARLDTGSAHVTLGWPAPLPRPVLSGDTATYRDVLPGVDLRMRASATGFSEVLVVGSRAAASDPGLSAIRFTLAASGVTIRTEDGSLTGVDASGATVFQAPAPAMWDSSTPAVPGDPSRVGTVASSYRGGVLTLRPDRAMLSATATRYPVMIDPSFTAGMQAWTNALVKYPTTAFWNGSGLPADSNGKAMVGHWSGDGSTARLFFQMNTSSMNSKHILGATFRINEQWANSCTASAIDLWVTGGISSSTTWNNQPSWMTDVNEIVAAKGNEPHGCADGILEFNATAAVQAAHDNGWPSLTLGLRAPDETDSDGWKRFDPTSATLQIDYNSVPTVGTRTTVPASTCVVNTGGAPAAGDPLLNNARPTFQAVAADADTSDNNETGTFTWQKWNGTGWVAAGSAADPILRAAGTVTQVQTPALPDGAYRWQVQISQPVMPPYSGTDVSGWSSWCEFGIDSTPPPAPGVSSPQYPSGCAPCGGVGVTGAFTLTAGAPDVTDYWWGTADPPATHVSAGTPGGPVTVQWTPTASGPTTLFVQSGDAAGNRSAETRYQFTVDAPTPEVALWPVDETGGTTLADATGHGHTATLTGGTLGAPARLVAGTSLSLSGASQSAQTTGPVLDTSTSYTVSAWVDLASTGTYRSVLSQDGVHSSGFQLQYEQACNCWELVLPVSDTTSPSAKVARSATPAVTGVWTLLTAVYDAGSGTASLYVNGALSGTATGVGPQWAAGGAFTIGRTRWNDASGSYFAGSVADVHAWQRVLSASEVAALAAPTNVGLWHFDDPDIPIAFDDSGYFNDLNLQGDAQIPDSGAGHNGTGLLLMDGGGYAQSSGQVLHTNQSFTVAAWVRVDGTSLPSRNLTAASQSGVVESGFYLGYRIISGTPRWSFSMPGLDVQGANGWTDAASASAVTTADLGRWAHLTGIYDASTNTMSLYVNGTLAGTATRTTPAFDTTGPFNVGAAKFSVTGPQSGLTDLWVGAIDEVKAYAGVVANPASLM